MKHCKQILSLLIVLAVVHPTFANTAQTNLNKEIQKAAQEGDTSKFMKLAKDKSLDLNAQDEEGMTPLMSAALGGNEKIVQFLLAKKVNLETKNKVGDTALAVALTNDQFDIAKQLIKAGAKVDITVAGDNSDTLLIRSASGNLGTTKLILEKNGNLINKTNKLGETALMKSIEFRYNDITKLLLANGANTKLKNKDGKTALDIAKESNNEEAIKLLSKK
ncbi:ankyrin repeat domain-containing protein [Bdellovibrio sp. HCB-162]|uniref:ankyrin repeat domain-containing protein n=1 Tax=Bdellovibrio sp. HCB-162 TaxID=3394234 RepID=UPI0039BCDD14